MRFLLLSTLLTLSAASKLLILTPFGTTSIRGVFSVLCEELLSRGHVITFVSSGEPFPKHENLTHIESPHTAVDQIDPFKNRVGLEVFKMWKSAFPKAAREFYENDEVMSLWHSRHEFDTIIINSAANEMAFPFLLGTTAPFITLQPAGMDPIQLAHLGNLVSPATLPSIILPYTDHMNFWERLVNTLTLVLLKYSFRRSVGIPLANVLTEFFPDLPDPR